MRLGKAQRMSERKERFLAAETRQNANNKPLPIAAESAGVGTMRTKKDTRRAPKLAAIEPLPPMTDEQRAKLQRDMEEGFRQHEQRSALKDAAIWIDDTIQSAERLIADMRRRRVEVIEETRWLARRSDMFSWAMNDADNFARNLNHAQAALVCARLAKAFDDEPKGAVPPSIDEADKAA